MVQDDILLSVPGHRFVNSLDRLLSALTHRSPLRRRFALLLLFTTYLIAFSAWSNLRSRLSSHSTLTKRAIDSLIDVNEESEALYYVPVPATKQQEANYANLLNLIASRKSAFDADLFTEKALSSSSSSSTSQYGVNTHEKVVGVTAVVLHWKRTKGLKLVLKQISRYPFIREIIIWNNRPGLSLNATDFPLSAVPGSTLPLANLRIFNSPANLHDAGKHFGCTMASFSHCYFNDDDWLNVYLDAMYSKYLETSVRRNLNQDEIGPIVSNTLPIIHLEHRRWRFDNPEINLHTGFSWLGTGTFAPKSFSVRFLNQQTSLTEPLTRSQSLVSDMFFSLWTNSYPEQFSNNLVAIDVEGGEVGWSRGTGVDQWSVVYANLLDAVRKLCDVLHLASPHLIPDPFPVTTPARESDMRSPCANDECIFTTSITPFIHPSALSYEPQSKKSFLAAIFGQARSRHSKSKKGKKIENLLDTTPKFDPWAIDHIKQHEAQYNLAAQGWPTDSWWIERGSWHLAVDGKGEKTCWQSWKPPDIGDHFGLVLVAPRVVSTLKIVGSYGLKSVSTGTEDEADWFILTMREAHHGKWERRYATSLVSTAAANASDQSTTTILLEPLESRPGASNKITRFKFVSKSAQKQKIEICSFDLDGWQL